MSVTLLLLIFFLTSPAFGDWEDADARPALIRPGGIVLFMNARAPLSFETLSQNQIPVDAVDAGIVTCQSCQHGVSVPVTPPTGTSRGTSVSGAGGNCGFERALANLKKIRPDVRGIYDVKIDYHRISVLGIYRRLCIEITARGFK